MTSVVCPAQQAVRCERLMGKPEIGSIRKPVGVGKQLREAA